MKLFSFLIIFFLIFSVNAQDTPNQPKESLKIILFSGSDWCRPCMKMKEELIKKEDFSQLLGKVELFIADFPQDEKKITKEQRKINEQLADQYNAEGMFPKMVIVDQQGKLIAEKSGYRSQIREEYMTFIQSNLQ